jgi:Pyruvate/2-oxoacid:ferredoxin oxidoreductase delta subunit
MTEVNYYKIVRQKLTLGPLSAPKHEKIYELLKIFWNDDEIKILSHFPNADKSITLKELSDKTGIAEDELKSILKKLRAKRTIARTGKKKFGLLPLVPGIFELYFIGRQDSEENLKKVAEIYRYIFENILPLQVINKDFEMFRPLLPIESKEKLIQVNESIESQTRVLSYELVEDLMNQNEIFVRIPCQCRYIAELEGNPCKVAPSEMGCLMTGMAAEMLIKYDRGIKLSKSEAIEYLKKTEKAGLVHCSTNDSGSDHLMFICNCCSCHCGALHSTKKDGIKAVLPSNYKPKINDDLCIKCETCQKKCPMGAIYHQWPLKPDSSDEKMMIVREICISCGVCAANCSKNAIKMEKVQNQIPPKQQKIGSKTFMELLA